jgi:excinuclease ABC subunit A
MKETKGHCLYIFDEPSTGLHMQDVEKLILVFNKLADQGHSVLIVEHNQDIIQSSDWIIELGPGGGDQGGCIVYEGIPKLN